MMQGQDMFSSWGAMGLGPITMLIIPILVIVLIVWVIRSFVGGSSPSSPNAPGPIAILEKRFANGEIDEQEYKQRRKALEQ